VGRSYPAAGGHTPAAARNPSPRVAGGTFGGLMGGMTSGRRTGPPSLLPQGDALYLWGLVILELLAIGWLRSAFKRYHGG
jgi:predicted lipid-binding transport protein (Tim44 family)